MAPDRDEFDSPTPARMADLLADNIYEPAATRGHCSQCVTENIKESGNEGCCISAKATRKPPNTGSNGDSEWMLDHLSMLVPEDPVGLPSTAAVSCTRAGTGEALPSCVCHDEMDGKHVPGPLSSSHCSRPAAKHEHAALHGYESEGSDSARSFASSR
jgi:hypothetical protein